MHVCTTTDMWCRQCTGVSQIEQKMDPIDNELLELLSRLNKIQAEVGGAKNKEEVKNNGKVDKFVDVKSQMIERVADLREKIETSKSGTGNPRELIAIQSQIRTESTRISEDWQELNRLYLVEAKKRKVDVEVKCGFTIHVM